MKRVGDISKKYEGVLDSKYAKGGAMPLSRIILSSFGMAEEDILQIAAEIAEMLKNNKALPPETDEDDEGEGVDFDGENEIDFLD